MTTHLRPLKHASTGVPSLSYLNTQQKRRYRLYACVILTYILCILSVCCRIKVFPITMFIVMYKLAVACFDVFTYYLKILSVLGYK